MENGNKTTSTSSSSFSQHQQQLRQDTSTTSSPSDCNLNSTELSTTITAAGTQFLNLTLNSSSSNRSNCNSMSNPNTKMAAATTTTSSTPPSASLLGRTAGISLNKNNNYLNSNNGASSASNINNSIISIPRINERTERLNSLQFNDEIVEQNIGDIVEYCEVLEDHLQQPQTGTSSYNNTKMLSIIEDPDNDANVCCRRNLKSLAANGASSMSSGNNTGAKTKSRCRKCSCRDAFKRFLIRHTQDHLIRPTNSKRAKTFQITG
ncbi:hypothetical protein EVAR_73798_1 [Eumeta japonica]|uniref:Uncharacterized protein n=1 Tax=Eumeta variegata TaxID=151549 RepID=A0A4C1TH05_EUMVA|nr:hypothetical protein EVAR_73798_1 [Eumeta japonica]